MRDYTSSTLLGIKKFDCLHMRSMRVPGFGRQKGSCQAFCCALRTAVHA